MAGEGGRPDIDPIRSVWVPPCPSCGQLGVPIVFGRPDWAALEAAGDRLIALAGCVRPEQPPHWECPAGHQWSTSDEDWLAALNQTMWGRPRCRACGGATKYLLYGDEMAGYFEAELASGDAEVALGPGPPDTSFAHICRTCGTVRSS
jgi:hypothetical protein